MEVTLRKVWTWHHQGERCERGELGIEPQEILTFRRTEKSVWEKERRRIPQIQRKKQQGFVKGIRGGEEAGCVDKGEEELVAGWLPPP